MAPVTVNDVIAVTAFIGSIFGSGGGAEASNADLLAQLEDGLGPVQGRAAWEDAMLFDDPEAPTTITQHYNYGPFTGGPVRGSVVIDADSIVSLDPRAPGAAASPTATSATATTSAGPTGVFVDASRRRPAARRRTSSSSTRSDRRAGDTLAVMGPQLGYYYPEIVEQIDLHGPGYRGAGRRSARARDVHPHRPDA